MTKIQQAARSLGRKGGKARSPKKTRAVAINSTLGGRVTWHGDVAKRAGWTVLVHDEGFRLRSPHGFVSWHHGTRTDAERALRRVAVGLLP